MNKPQIEFKAYVDGKEICQTGPYDLGKILNDINDEAPFNIGMALANKLQEFYEEEAEEMFQEDYQRVGH